MALDWESLEKRLCSVDTKLFIDDVTAVPLSKHFAGSDSAITIALAEHPEYHFLDSSSSICDYATISFAVCSLSALIASQCIVHRIKC